jgi:hypothetical protein
VVTSTVWPSADAPASRDRPRIAIFDDDRLVEPPAQRRPDEPRDRISGAARRERDDQRDALRRIVDALREAGARQG